jgi:MFS family permease
MTTTTPHFDQRNDRHPIASVPTLDRACRTAIALMRGGIDGSRVAIRVEGLQVVDGDHRRRRSRAMGALAVRTAAAGALIGALLGLFGSGSILPWMLFGALVALAVGVVAGAVDHLISGHRRRNRPPLLGARRFVVQCDAAEAERAREIVS